MRRPVERDLVACLLIIAAMAVAFAIRLAGV